MKHTPGPWSINDFNDCVFANGKIIYERHRSDLGKETFEANVKLIAAAPEMIDLLIEATEVITHLDHRHNGKCYNPNENDCTCTLCKIKRAIKKATE